MFKLILKNFRLFSKKQIIFNQSPTLIIGPNGSGKTSILEAIYFLSTTKSFRTQRKSDLIKFNCFESFLSLVFSSKNMVESLIFKFKPNIYRLGKKRILREDFLNHFFVSLFWWGDFKVVYGSPSDRRRLLNLFCLQIEPKYLKWLILFKKALKERNFALKKNDYTLLDVWEEKLAQYGVKIYQVRKKAILIINKKLPRTLSRLRQGLTKKNNRRAEIIYKGTFLKKTAFLQKLKQSRKKDLISGYSSLGPHRDDLLFVWGRRSLSSFSQGEIKIFLLALKIGFLESQKKKNRLFLIDDALAGLDKEIKKQLMVFLKKERVFLIMTSQDKEKFTGADIIKLE